MDLPPEVVFVCQAMWNKFGELMRSTDEDKKRQWCRMTAEQLVFQFPSGQWGVKRAGVGRPPSKDTIARNAVTGLECWDLFIGGATPNPSPNFAHAEYHAIKDQIFIGVSALNHFATAPPPTLVDDDLIVALERIIEGVEGIKQGAEQIRDHLLTRW